MQTKTVINYPELELREVDMIKIIAIGYSEKEILNILEITSKEYHTTLNRLFYKFNSTDLYDLIIKCLKSKIIDRYDIVKDEVKEAAIFNASIIYQTLTQKNYIFFNFKDNLQSNIINFVNDVYTNFNNSKKNITLTENELNYCCLKIFKYKNLKSKNINKLILDNRQLEKNLIKKFNTGNFFNVIRIAFELNLIENKKYIIHNYANDEFFKKIVIPLLSNKVCFNNESKNKMLICIYNILVDYYNKIENQLFNLE